MRARPEEREFAKFLLDVGDGVAKDEENCITLPQECKTLPLDNPVGETKELHKEIFEEAINDRDWKTVAERAILAPLNVHVDEWNEKILPMIPMDNPEDDEKINYSIDAIVNDGQSVNEDVFPMEYLHTLNPSGFALLIFL